MNSNPLVSLAWVVVLHLVAWSAGHRVHAGLAEYDLPQLHPLKEWSLRQSRGGSVLDVLRDLFVDRRTTECVRIDSGSDLTALEVREWLERLAV